jgi:large subunit ribosomal protein L30e
MDLAHALKVAIQTGTVKLGVHETLESAEKKTAKLVVVAKTCPDERLLKAKKIERSPVYHYDGTSVELGAACGKPFPISALAVIDPGSSAILSVESG